MRRHPTDILVTLAWALSGPGPLSAQTCINIAGTWSMTEQATLKCVLSIPGFSETTTDPLSASRSVTILQTGCSISFNPGTIGAGRLIQYERTPFQGQISGTSVTVAGGNFIPAEGAKMIEASYTATGQASDTSMTLSGSGVEHFTQPLPEMPSVTGDINCLLSSTANFTRSAPTTAAPALRTTQPVLQAFGGGSGISPGTWVELYGQNFTTQTRDWTGLIQNNQAPTSIGGVSVNIGNKPAYLYYVSPAQINAQVPDGVGTGPVAVEVVSAGGRTSTTAQVTALSPVLLTTPSFLVGGRQYAAALFAADLNQGRQVFVGRTNLVSGATFRPARPGDALTIFAVGCGPTNPASAAGQVVQGVRPLANAAQVRFGQVAAVTAGYLSAGAIGLCQLNVTVPNVTGDAAGDLPISVAIAGVQNSQTLYTTVTQ